MGPKVLKNKGDGVGSGVVTNADGAGDTDGISIIPPPPNSSKPPSPPPAQLPHASRHCSVRVSSTVHGGVTDASFCDQCKTRRGPLRDALPVVEAADKARVAQMLQGRAGPTARVAVDGNVAVLAAGEIHRGADFNGCGVPKRRVAAAKRGETFHERGVGNVPVFPLAKDRTSTIASNQIPSWIMA